MQNAAYVKSMTSTQVKDHLPRILGADMITIAQDAVESSYTGPNVFNRADAKTIQGYMVLRLWLNQANYLSLKTAYQVTGMLR
ncbi:hypothetical protein NLJ36_22525 (plasmid) [Salmonella enterica subsp. enterica serovar Gallinarum]|nr:hypothetical protein NLJ36_22525 [Salmonella enterica subsp. enterica serovar Gallinarum]